MKQETKTQSSAPANQPARFHLNEDWFSVILAFLLILLSVIGILGKHGIPITF
jgi:hypothetical protein